MCANGGYPDFQVTDKALGKIQLIDTPMTMTLQSFCTRAVAIGPNIGPGVVSPCIRRTFLPLAGPHSYTRITPYGVSTSRAPGKRLGEYGRAAAWASDRNGKSVSRGDGMAFGGFIVIIKRHFGCLYVIKERKTAARAAMLQEGTFKDVIMCGY